MTDFAPNFTQRATARYRSHTATHQITIRGAGDVGMDETRNALGEMLTALKPYIVAHGPQDFSWLDASYTAPGADLSQPMSLPAVALTSFAGGAAPFKPHTAYETSFEARGGGGSLYSISIFGLWNNAGEDASSPGRIVPAESAALLSTLNLLHASTLCCAIDGTALVWKNYANFGQNAYWKRKVRNG